MSSTAGVAAVSSRVSSAPTAADTAAANPPATSACCSAAATTASERTFAAGGCGPKSRHAPASVSRTNMASSVVTSARPTPGRPTAASA